MNYAEIKNFDIANGLGVRVSLFVSGCTHHCKNCFNQMTWDFKYGKEFTKEVEDLIIDYLKPEHITGLSLLGGLFLLLEESKKHILKKIFGVIQAIFLTENFYKKVEQDVK